MAQPYDLLIIGGGINGTAIARDAAGRGLSVLLVEKDDLASGTSSASSKLIHGGLRYLEQLEFKLVHEALHEREVLLRTAPHLVKPLAFILPNPEKGRPWWMVRLGLRIYDLLAGRNRLPAARTLSAQDAAFGEPLKPHLRGKLALYWDAWVDDARLVALNAVDASERGAEISTRTALLSARREDGLWRAHLSNGRLVAARMIVNAAGPWVEEVLGGRLHAHRDSHARLVKGSHIVVPALYDGDHAYILQQPDKRVVFALPYEGRFTLIGTTDIAVASPQDARIDDAEIRYLCAAVNRYFLRRAEARNVVWSYSGIRALHDDGAANASAVTRDYHLELNEDGPPLLSLFGGKITTARALAEEALNMLGVTTGRWTAGASLPGGDFETLSQVEAGYPWLPRTLAHRLVRSYGTRISAVIGAADSLEKLGRHFGSGLYEAEVDYLLRKEFARTAEDIMWRRTKIGLFLDPEEQNGLRRYLDSDYIV
ncbi:glycerol-3-phosphate dehydrogenase [Allosphingosinicella flava]|uniref:Glycerol-3-phosphate dehydrogenase n=1 Tax=Allosphingosinicella flava TaxID=2771430 RepID=A0A7T2LMY5_9SPHN|nr:glycerol-3-phosphate dehydrogenase [Sphingosinicella flava]QPQ56035.1 glycerol-3-phosphate dehydrogenase [Sphingosinicella flava]